MEKDWRTLVHTVMTRSMKLSIRIVSSRSRRTLGSVAKSAIRVPWITGAASSVVADAKLIALGALNWTWPEKIGVGTRLSAMGGPSESTPSKEGLRPEAMVEGQS